MKTTILIGLLFGLVPQARAGWVELFNGTDFTNFGGAGKTELNGYLVKDGVIESTPKCKSLVTENDTGWSDILGRRK